MRSLRCLAQRDQVIDKMLAGNLVCTQRKDFLKLVNHEHNAGVEALRHHLWKMNGVLSVGLGFHFRLSTIRLWRHY